MSQIGRNKITSGPVLKIDLVSPLTLRTRVYQVPKKSSSGLAHPLNDCPAYSHSALHAHRLGRGALQQYCATSPSRSPTVSSVPQRNVDSASRPAVNQPLLRPIIPSTTRELNSPPEHFAFFSPMLSRKRRTVKTRRDAVRFAPVGGIRIVGTNKHGQLALTNKREIFGRVDYNRGCDR
eukprot:6961716-Pyramimonas_sp.AAC.1